MSSLSLSLFLFKEPLDIFSCHNLSASSKRCQKLTKFSTTEINIIIIRWELWSGGVRTSSAGKP